MFQKRISDFIRWVLNVIKLFGFILLSLIPAMIMIILISYQGQLPTLLNIMLGLIVFIFTILIILFLGNKYFKYSKEKIQSMGWSDIGYAFLFLVLARIFFETGTLLTRKIYGEEMVANDEEIINLVVNSNSFIFYSILLVFLLIILIPIIEELVYRGIATHILFGKGSFWLPLIIISTVFGLMHTPTNIISFFMYVFLGVVFFLSYFRRKNILDAILVHILNNAVAFIFLLLAL